MRSETRSLRVRRYVRGAGGLPKRCVDDAGKRFNYGLVVYLGEFFSEELIRIQALQHGKMVLPGGG